MYDQKNSDFTGTCFSCGRESELYKTISGFWCTECCPPIQDTPMYAPSLKYEETDTPSELSQNFEQFTDELDDIMFDLELADGSEYTIDTFPAHAVFLKHGDEWEEWITSFADEVACHYEQRTELDKHGTTCGWGGSQHDDSQEEYETHAELAPVIEYSALRSALMQLSLRALSGNKDTMNVVSIGEDSVDYYGDEGRITVPYDKEFEGGDN